MENMTVQRAFHLRSRRWAGAALLFALLPAGCASMNDTEKGAVAGGALGAVTGGIVGHALHNTGAGALVGAAAGAVGGGLIGNAMDEQKKETDAKIAAAAAAQRPVLGVTDIVQMVHQGMSDTVIINEIRTTGSVFAYLSPNDLGYLKQNGVDDAVITEMQATAQRRVYSAAPVYPVQPVYVYDPPPPVAVGVGFGYGRRW